MRNCLQNGTLSSWHCAARPQCLAKYAPSREDRIPSNGPVKWKRVIRRGRNDWISLHL